LINILKLLFSVFVCLSAGFLGSFFTRGSLDTWYVHINKPSFTPPSWVFAPVWTALYILMGIAAFLVWRKGLDNKNVQLALLAFLIQLVLNALWTPLFFGMRSPLYGLIEIILLWLAILVTTTLFFGISRLSAFLLLPYILWVSFAVVLNATIVYLNFPR